MPKFDEHDMLNIGVTDIAYIDDFEKIPAKQLLAADVNGDGKVDTTDARLILQKVS